MKRVIVFLLFIIVRLSVSGQAVYWEKISDEGFKRVAVGNNSTIYGAKDYGRALFRSNDNGRSWVKLDEVFGDRISDLFFLDNCVNVIVNNDSALYSSEDGLAWMQMKTPYVPVWVGEDSAGKLYVSGNTGKLSVTTDNGENWTDLFVADRETRVSGAINQNDAIFIIVGYTDLLRSFDTGLSWEICESVDRVHTSVYCSGDSLVGLYSMVGSFDVEISTDAGNSFSSYFHEGIEPSTLIYFNEAFYVSGYMLGLINSDATGIQIYGDVNDELYKLHSDGDTLYTFGRRGAYRTFPGYEAVMPKNFIPKNKGNTWQYREYSSFMYDDKWWLDTTSITRDTIVNGKKYFASAKGSYSRYDSEENYIYILQDGQEYVSWSFNHPPGTIIGEGSQRRIVYQDVENKFGRQRIVKGTYNPGYINFFGSSYWEYIEGVGFNQSGSSDNGHGMASSGRYLASAIIIDENGNEEFFGTCYTPLVSVTSVEFDEQFEHLLIKIDLRHPFDRPNSFGGFTYLNSAKCIYKFMGETINTTPTELVIEIKPDNDEYEVLIPVNGSTLPENARLMYRFETVDKSLKPFTANIPESGWFEEDIVLSQADKEQLVMNYELMQNYPNPFNPVTEIRFSLKEAVNTKIIIYNSLGQLVKVLLNKYISEGDHSVHFNGSDLPSGIYYYKIEAGAFSDVKKMVLIK